MLRQHESATFYFERALQFGPQEPFTHLHYGLFLLATGNQDLGRQHLDLVIALAPGSAAADLASHWLGLTSH
jgi:hypothetical protein